MPAATATPERPAATATPTLTVTPLLRASATAVIRPPVIRSPTTAAAVPTPEPDEARETAEPPPPNSAAASLPGEWEFRADAGKGIIAGTLRFRSTADGLTGVYVGLHGNATELSNLHAAGAGISFDLVTPTAVWHLDGTLSGDTIDGTFQTAERSIRWTAVRRKVGPPVTPRS